MIFVQAVSMVVTIALTLGSLERIVFVVKGSRADPLLVQASGALWVPSTFVHWWTGLAWGLSYLAFTL
jgi:hypothetical protein